ncbi:rho GDP-dissociation inhibitor 3 isoform X2 [Trachinotus anak]|uniref:rho GDP-dissociation inhibitor 3 isoform X2 n=1 Tax=Trachinotus anak TaxID=443729 RepID=UPI0039F22A06
MQHVIFWLQTFVKGLMADKKDLPIEEEEDERNLNYNPPALKSLQEIQELDKDDESLVKYKQTLLGMGPVTADLSGPNVWVTRLTLLCDEAPGPITMDLTGDLSALKEKSFSLQEGAKYRLKIHFKVKREIVAGLRYHHVTYRKGIRVDKVSYMVGSYGPRAEEHEFLSPSDEAPKGMMSRGHYQIKSHFIDDDKNIYLAWEWNLDIKKDWNE